MSDMAFPSPVRVVVVDDSALVRKLLRAILDADPRIQVVGMAGDPLQARAMIKETDPDVVTLDIEMPHMDGLSFLEKIMTLRPMPVVMISSLTGEGAETTLAALEMGAVDFVEKPTACLATGLAELAREITDKVVAAAGARRRLAGRCAALRPPAGTAANRLPPLRTGDGIERSVIAVERSVIAVERSVMDIERSVIAIGASTGGVEALREVVTALPSGMPAILMTVHMPAAYTGRFAARLDLLSALTVKEAEHGEPVLPGHVYVAPGGQHLELADADGGYRCRLHRQEKVQGHRPSVDVLFASVAAAAGSRGVGVILTGMGRDGAEGLKRMRDAGARTVGQDERSCLVYGMPRCARELGAVEREVPLPRIASALAGFFAGPGRAGDQSPSGFEEFR